jgi:hypothetical protein
MTLEAPRRVKWRAASRPRPVFPPVTRIVLPAKEVLGTGGVTKSCEWRKRRAIVGRSSVLVWVW